MNLTEYFYSLSNIDEPYNKYASYSIAFNNPYRIATSVDAFRYEKFDMYLKKFIAEQGKCIAMPNIFNKEVIGIMFRAISSKQFRYYTECRNIPYGAGVNSKPYYKPWIIVESALDSDFLRNFYPFVIATNGTAISHSTTEFIKGTCSTVYCGFDNDTAGEESFHNFCMKHSGKDNFFVKRFRAPNNFDGKPLKDFGEILDCLHNKNLEDYDFYVMSIRSNLVCLNLSV